MVEKDNSQALLEKIESLLSENQLIIGGDAYVLSNKWLTKLRMAAKRKDQFNLPIDNTMLLDSKGHLKAIAISPSDYILVNQHTWQFITSLVSGGPEIKVPVVENPNTHQPVAITQPLAQRLFIKNPEVHSLPIDYTITDTLKTLKEKVCKRFGWLPDMFRVRNFPGVLGRVLDESKYVYENPDISDGIYFESQNYKLQFDPIFQEDEVQYQTIKKREYKPGLVGLKNFGNTCFMNSVLQCLGHIDEISKGVESIETKDPIAKEFQNSIRAVWNKGDHSKLLKELTKKAPQFEGHLMQDPCEFMLKLFDILKVGSQNPKDNLIHNIFDFTQEHTVSCTNCSESSVSNTIESLLNVTLRDFKRPILYVPFDRAREPYTVENLSDIDGFYTQYSFDSSDPTAPLIALEIPDDDMLYAKVFIDLEGTNRIFKNIILPILVPVKVNSDQKSVISSIEEMIMPYWSGNSENDQLSSIEQYLPAASSSNDKKAQKVEITQFPDRFTKSDIVSQVGEERVANEPVRALIKGCYAHKSLGFDWKLVSETSVQVATLGSQKNLLDLLKDDAKPEKIDEDNTRCSKCGSPVQRSSSMKSTPQVLALALSRFRFSNGTPTKNCSNVEYPDKFDIKEIYPDLDSTTYNLCGVVTHKGGLMGGHCEAYCPFNGRWYQFSDEYVGPINNNGIDPQYAYILFYKKSD